MPEGAENQKPQVSGRGLLWEVLYIPHHIWYIHVPHHIWYNPTTYGIYLIRFHKVQRRRRQTPQSAAGGQEGEEERAERLRATERMTLRHGRQGKWAREVLARKKRDPAARTALSEHSLRGRALTQHAAVESEGDSEG